MSNEDAMDEAFKLYPGVMSRHADKLSFLFIRQSKEEERCAFYAGWQAREAEIQQLREQLQELSFQHANTCDNLVTIGVGRHALEIELLNETEKFIRAEVLSHIKAQALLEAADDIEANRIIFESFSHWLRARAGKILKGNGVQ